MTPHQITSRITLVSLTMVGILLTTHAAPQTYREYETGIAYCENTDRSWGRDNTLIPIVTYPELTTESINSALATWRANTQVIGDEKRRLMADLDPVRIGGMRGYKALEIARIGYRTQMNSLFACGIISSRIETLDGLIRIVDSKFPHKNSETYQKLKKESDILKNNSNKLKCTHTITSDGAPKIDNIVRLINSSSRQYCHYRTYLDYLSSQTEDVLAVQQQEIGVGQGSGTQISTDTTEWNIASRSYQIDIAREISRADMTLPRVMRTYVEMERTYGAHIILLLIYDDYIRLRESLARYMALSSQLYQKANNAQNANQQ